MEQRRGGVERVKEGLEGGPEGEIKTGVGVVVVEEEGCRGGGVVEFLQSKERVRVRVRSLERLERLINVVP